VLEGRHRIVSGPGAAQAPAPPPAQPEKVPDYLLNTMKDEPPYGAPPDKVRRLEAASSLKLMLGIESRTQPQGVLLRPDLP
jgi:hypothetical protein